jgi:hypothetical protein
MARDDGEECIDEHDQVVSPEAGARISHRAAGERGRSIAATSGTLHITHGSPSELEASFEARFPDGSTMRAAISTKLELDRGDD